MQLHGAEAPPDAAVDAQGKQGKSSSLGQNRTDDKGLFGCRVSIKKNGHGSVLDGYLSSTVRNHATAFDRNQKRPNHQGHVSIFHNGTSERCIASYRQVIRISRHGWFW
jgi:hypothetical protein